MSRADQMLSNASSSTGRETRGRMRHPAATLANFHKSLLKVVLDNCLPTSMSHGEKGKFFRTVAGIIGCSSKHAQKVYEDLVQSYKRNELRSLYKSGVQEELLSEIGSLIQGWIALTGADRAESEHIEMRRSLSQHRLYTGKMVLGRNQSSTAFEDLSSSVLSESSSGRSSSGSGRRDSWNQDSDSLKRLADELAETNRLLKDFLRRHNPVSDENGQPERL